MQVIFIPTFVEITNIIRELWVIIPSAFRFGLFSIVRGYGVDLLFDSLK